MLGQVAGLFGMALFASACGEGEPSSPAEAFCKGYCKAAERCDAVTPGTDCRSECVAERPGLSRLNIEGALRVGECVSGFACATLSDESAWRSSVQACSAAAAAAIEPTPKLRALCAAFSEAWFDCNTVISTSDCEGDFAVYSDGVLDGLSECTARQSCDELKSCVQGVLGS